MSDRFVQVAPGRRLFVRSEGEGPAVLILHGFTGSSESVVGIADALPGFRRVRVDLLGHGRSDAPDELDTYSMDTCVEDLARVLDALGIPSTDVVGYSMGARVALALAVRMPERVRRCVLIGARAGIEAPEARAERVRADAALAARIEDEGLESFVDDWMALPLFASQLRLGKAALAAARAARLRQRPEGLARSLRGMGAGAQPPLFERLGALRVPILFVAGGEDAAFVDAGRDLASRIPTARFLLIPEVGHAAHLEAADEFARITRSFLSEPPDGGTMDKVDWKTARDYEDIRFETVEGIAKITIDRPEVHNAFRPRTITELIDAFARAREDHTIGVILFTGAGGQAFCSGGDQTVRGSAGYVDDEGISRLNVLDLQRVIRSLPKPIIALVPGWAIGGGHVLHLICDLTIAAEGARFGQTGPKVGSFDAGFGAAYLARVVGQKKAREIWFLCDQYDAQEALEMGLINKVVPPEELEEAGVAWARRILRHSPFAIRCLKAAFNADCDGQAGLQELAGHATQLFYMTEEAQEGRDAFVQKREPDFSPFPWRP